MVTYKPIPIGPEADAWWKERLLYFYSHVFCKYVKDETKEAHHAPTRYRHSGMRYAICIEE